MEILHERTAFPIVWMLFYFLGSCTTESNANPVETGSGEVGGHLAPIGIPADAGANRVTSSSSSGVGGFSGSGGQGEQVLTTVTLFEDDFATWNTTQWEVGNWTLGRTSFGAPPAVLSEGSVTFLRLELTCDGGTLGKPIGGTEIYSKDTFGGQPLSFEARIRVASEAPGIVNSFFTWASVGSCSAGELADEIDFEFLTNDATSKVLATAWNDWCPSCNCYNNGVNHQGETVTNSEMNRSEWTTLTIQWWPGTKTEWYTNGTLSRTETSVCPDGAAPIRFNTWAPDSDWKEAYGVNLCTGPTSASQYAYDIDWVKVTTM